MSTVDLLVAAPVALFLITIALAFILEGRRP